MHKFLTTVFLITLFFMILIWLWVCILHGIKQLVEFFYNLNGGSEMKHICKNCKYYGEKKFTCSSDKFIYDLNFDSFNNTGARFYYWDGEGYSAGFNVEPNFGCIHWEREAK